MSAVDRSSRYVPQIYQINDLVYFTQQQQNETNSPKHIFYTNVTMLYNLIHQGMLTTIKHVQYTTLH